VAENSPAYPKQLRGAKPSRLNGAGAPKINATVSALRFFFTSLV
jgi:hypothetical protein